MLPCALRVHVLESAPCRKLQVIFRGTVSEPSDDQKLITTCQPEQMLSIKRKIPLHLGEKKPQKHKYFLIATILAVV